MSDENGMMSTQDRLIYMANQIARNFEAEGLERSVDMCADHIRKFWDPGMRQRIIGLARDRAGELSPVAAAAVARIAVC